MWLERINRIDMARGLRAVLIAQFVIALLLVFADIDHRWIPLRKDPRPSSPISPGDQVRHYDPSVQTPRYMSPTQLPTIELPSKLPKRLQFTQIEDPDLGRLLLVNGPIEQGDAKRFEAFLASASPEVVVLNSPGGSVYEALEIGRFIRSGKLDTAVLSGMACVSACPYILAGGVERLVSVNGVVGLHQHYYEKPRYLPVFLAVEDIQTGQGETMLHLTKMGIDPAIMILALKTPPDEIYVLVEEELLESRLATKVE